MFSPEIVSSAGAGKRGDAAPVAAAAVKVFPPLRVLSFSIGNEEYGVDIQKVQELRGYEAVTTLANAARMLKGVINLRGVIVPILDMRIKLGFDEPTYDSSTVVVILNIAEKTVGIVVDTVSDVMTLTDAQIKEPPALGTMTDASFLLGVAVVEERMLLLVEPENMFSDAILDHAESSR